MGQFQSECDFAQDQEHDPRTPTKLHEKKPVFRDASCDFVDRALAIEIKGFKITRYYSATHGIIALPFREGTCAPRWEDKPSF